jgi:hypothetical protein
MTMIKSGFEAGNFGTKPTSDVTVGVNRNADLTLLYDGVDLNGTKSVGTHAHMHLAVHLQIGGGTRRKGCGRRRWRRRWRGVEHLVSLGK